MTTDFERIREALNAGDKATARALLPPLIKTRPTADLWVMAARACESKADAIKCLRKALDLDPYHNRANTLLLQIEKIDAPTSAEWERLTAPPRPRAKTTPVEQGKRKRRMTTWRWITLISFFLLGSACSLFTLNMVGLIKGVVTTATILTGGPTPVAAIQGIPIGQIQDAPVVVPSSHREEIGQRSSEDDRAVRTTTGGQDTDVLEHGYLHEYTFEARVGSEYAIYVQFLSFAANRVSRNVVVLRPDGTDVGGGCQRDQILEGDNNITLLCHIDVTGTWNVRILGRDGESVGVYFIGIERMSRAG
jgi:hypothetical protein